jgi:hypothetical protein
MNFDALLEELIGLLDAAGVRVRWEPLEDSRGGLCRIGGMPTLFLDEHADPLQSAILCAQTLCRSLDISEIYLRPGVREFIESAQAEAGQE